MKILNSILKQKIYLKSVTQKPKKLLQTEAAQKAAKHCNCKKYFTYIHLHTHILQIDLHVIFM